MGNELLSAGVNVTFDKKTVLQAALIIALLSIFAGVFLHFTTKILSKQ